MTTFPILTHQYVLVNPNPKPLSKLSVAEYILREIKQYGSSVAMINSLDDKSVTFDDVIQATVKVAEGLKLKGINEGDVVAICSENNLEYASVILGIVAAGATCSLLNPMYNFDELIHTLSISRPRMIFSSPLVVRKLEKCLQHVPCIEEIIVFGPVDSKANFSSYHDLIQNSGRFETFHFPNLKIEDSVAFLFCSSGTTGLPKCVELTHLNILNVLEFSRALWEGQSPGKVVLGLLPFFHGYGFLILMASLLNRTLNVLMMRFEEEAFLRAIEKYKITHLFVVPPIIVFLATHPLVSKYDLSSIKKVTCGAALLSKQTQMTAQKRLKLDSDIHQGYGATELSIACVAFPKDVKKIGSCGTIAPGMECKVIDLTTGKALPPFEKGELCFRGPFVMKGYRNNPEATRMSFDSQGWFHTGDIGYYDSEGFLYIVERLKELIKYKGFQVPPAELEALLINHPQIKEAGVIGIPDEEAGELPLAFVVLQPGAKLTEKQIQNYVAGNNLRNTFPENPFLTVYLNSNKVTGRRSRRTLVAATRWRLGVKPFTVPHNSNQASDQSFVIQYLKMLLCLLCGAIIYSGTGISLFRISLPDGPPLLT